MCRTLISSYKATVILNDQIYALGGRDYHHKALNTAEVYNPKTNE